METKHTPGPWTVTRGTNGFAETWQVAHTSALRDKTVADCGAVANTVYKGSTLDPIPTVRVNAENEANARLIAAAPDLLVALADAYEILADIHNEWPGRCRASGQMKLGRMRDALAAASGHASVDVQDSLGRVARARGEG